MVGIICWEIAVLADFCLRTIQQQILNNDLTINKETYAKILLYCIIVGRWIEVFLTYWGWYGQLACGVLAAYLLVASIQDIKTYAVYDFLHYLAVPAGGIFLLAESSLEKIISLLSFLLVQLIVFMRMYGAADGLVFLVCGIYVSRFGDGLSTYLLHMAAAFGALGIVQGFRGNINKRGNLKKPVAFVPYITATVWFFL